MMKYVGNGKDSFEMGDTTIILAMNKKGKLFHNEVFVFDEDGTRANSISNDSISKSLRNQKHL